MTARVVSRIAVGVLIACASARCGQKSTSPSGAPATGITTSVAPTLADADVLISWTAAPGASSAEVDVTTTTGGTVVVQANVGTATSYHWQHAAPGNYFITVKSKVGNVTLPSSALGFQLAPLKQVIDALFFASGPLSDLKLTSDSATWTGAPRGASYDLVVLSTVAGAPLQAAVTQITDAVNGQLSLTIKTVNALPSLGPHQILISDTLTTCFGANPPANVIGVACGYTFDAQGRSGALIGFSPGNGQTPAVVLHEICHGLLGLAHTVGSVAYSPLIMSTTYSSQGVFSPFETAAIKAVYANASVGPFSTRAAFRAAGLIE